MRLQRNTLAVVASIATLAGGGGVAWAAHRTGGRTDQHDWNDDPNGHDPDTTTTATTPTTTTTSTAATTASARTANTAKHHSKKHASRAKQASQRG